jgi:hypothetical protein
MRVGFINILLVIEEFMDYGLQMYSYHPGNPARATSYENSETFWSYRDGVFTDLM